MKKAELFAPESFWNASEEELKEKCNGCGTKGLGGFLVPDTLYLLSIKTACDIHDWMYQLGETIEDKDEADRTFLNNMLRIIEANKMPWCFGFINRLRRHRAYVYYNAVHMYGGPAYWSNKNKPEEMKTVEL